ncbi:MAG: hypothetical protein DRI69_10335 [Bacteroidetes bacterium]|nr:MAG: hypothetical protein DRI69_10335 [Bacteroidota bacterium]
MKRIITLAILVLTGWLTGMSQNSADALRYSMTEVLGTGRSIALGGAMGALGADFSVIGVNPAGLAAYRSSEFVITGAVLTQSTESILQDGGIPATTNSNSRFVISNLGLVFASRPKNLNWKSSNFAIGYHKTADYNLEFAYSGRTPGSITQRWAQNANGRYPEELNPFEELLAWETGAIYDQDPADLFYETDYELSPGAEILRRQTVKSTGGTGEILFSYAANYNEKLLFGLTLGVPIMSFEETKDYEEEDDPAKDLVPYFNALRFEETLSTTGSGLNLKVGATYKISKYLNLGGAFHTSTRYSLNDEFSTRLTYDYTDDNGRQVFTSPFDGPQEGSFQYNMNTPWSVLGNASYVLTKKESSSGKSKSRKKGRKKGRSRGTKTKSDEPVRTIYYGFLLAEIQYTDFTKAKFDYSGRGNGDQFQFEEDAVNEQIRNTLSSTIKLRFGAEYALNALRFRIGTVLQQSPYVDDSSFNTMYSAGIGYRFERVFLDLGYQHQKVDQGYIPYGVIYAPQPFVNNTTSYNRFVFTAGYKWL